MVTVSIPFIADVFLLFISKAIPATDATASPTIKPVFVFLGGAFLVIVVSLLAVTVCSGKV